MDWRSLVFGQVEFDENEEYLKFRFHFLYALIVTAMLFAMALLVASWSGLNNLGPRHQFSLQAFSVISLALLTALRGRKQWLDPIAWACSLAGFLLFLSALLFVPDDELRVVWFFLQIAGVYVVLGQRAGAAMTALTIASIAFFNRYLPVPISEHGMVTVFLSFTACGCLYHVYVGRSLLFYQRMTEANERFRQLSSLDPLTGVLNARAFTETSNRLIRLAVREGRPFSVLFIDLDHFKAVNDSHGHDAGDTVLKDVAACLSRRFRQSDVIGRVGGEEFLVFLPGADLPHAKQMAEQLRQDIENLMPEVRAGRIRVTASIGVAPDRPEHQTLAAIQREADLAMYQAKAQGRNRVTSFEPR